MCKDEASAHSPRVTSPSIVREISSWAAVQLLRRKTKDSRRILRCDGGRFYGLRIRSLQRFGCVRTFFPLSASLTLFGLTSNMMQHTSIVSFTPFGGVLRLFTCCGKSQRRLTGHRIREGWTSLIRRCFLTIEKLNECAGCFNRHFDRAIPLEIDRLGYLIIFTLRPRSRRPLPWSDMTELGDDRTKRNARDVSEMKPATLRRG